MNMETIGNIRTYRQIIKLQRAVMHAERNIISPHKLVNMNPAKWDRWVYFPIKNKKCPNMPEYFATPPRVLLRIFSIAQLPEESQFADLGSGLGMACFTASFFFKHVTGFEFDRRLFSSAERIRRKFNLNNVDFKKTDFLEADLKPYNVLFMYWPFKIKFAELMSDKLKETKPGTYIISHKYNKQDVFNPKDYTAIYPDLWKGITYKLLPATFVFRRK
jgi:hypothetical protein